MNVLVTGGAGYIGSHFVKYLKKKKLNVVVADNLSRGFEAAVDEDVKFYRADIADTDKMVSIMTENKIDAVFHFSAFAYVGESVQDPSLYYNNNVIGSIKLLDAMKIAGVKKFIFSSTCSLYGNPEIVPISESAKINPINPYAKTKYIVEQALADYSRAFGLKYVALRYFNAAGSDPETKIGESHDPEPHLIPLVLKTALKQRDKIFVFGDDYDTPDGTCIRDYIHVFDLADAHLRALNFLNEGNDSTVFNLGTGNGFSVMEIIKKVEEVTGLPVNYEVAERREGDPGVLVADNTKASTVLGWEPKYSLEEIITHAYGWLKEPGY